ncbi:protein translocase subunit secA [Georgenia satyanarayanai]|uniref:Protein translocase subunit SecA n=1 Tax=Georgenia satyanarayanai TaxID=860221 RepID=A0A2Y9AIR6_9MICO|nr:preprotein translocase subunit SecA [Georgenia satyanarayanai]PYF99356.1 protein translocase subunit secA [Georgenia satyanarayanai]SSA43168.1 protein translocase subunit secA [Georgenia satyanarayanai]
MASILSKILRMGEGRVLKQLTAIADQVNALEESVSGLTDAELRAETDQFKERLAAGETLDELLPEAFATVREAARRTLGQRHFDVQVMGGAALHLGNIAEMKTGEGKTLVATLPAYLNALTGKGVHVVTVNDYLAGYQAELMGRVYRFLGLTTGVVLSGQKPDERRKQYEADITYGTNNEFGFDYLRDNMAWSTAELVQRGHHFAIVDEVDSILIDEARTPLIISGPASGDSNKWYTEFARLASRLKRDDDYEVDEKKRNVGVLEPGIAKVEDHLGIDNLYESLNTPLIGFLNNALKAKELFKRDKDYIVTDGEVLIVDEHTGRVLAGRRYSEGMHQAIEAKEGVQIKAENQTLATITLQNYFRLYDKLAGMTGTAETEAAEFSSTYSIGVVPIPTNRSMQRIDQADLIYKNAQVKYKAIVEDIVERHAKGQPVLVGTTSVEKSELLSALLKRKGVPHEVLNAKNHAREAAIVAMAGRKGAVTVATNMAGRGTDIMLGGNAEHIAIETLRQRGLDPEESPEEYEAAWPEALEEARQSVAAEHEEVVELGGLYVLGTERHESRRIDNQLRGRSGRQGDPGESRFYLSMEDDLMRLFNSGLAMRVMDGSAFPDDMPLEAKMVSRGIASAQAQVEGRNFEIRKNVLKYDDVLSRQRTVVYEERRRVLEGEDLEDQVQSFLDDVVSGLVREYTAAPDSGTWDLETLWAELGRVYPVSITAEDVIEEAGGQNRLSADMLVEELRSDIHLAFQRREEELTPGVMRQLERRVVLSVLDRKWREHLYEMDYLKEGIGLRAMGQRDPLVEYQREGYQLFQAMNEAIKEEAVSYLFNLEVKVQQPEDAQAGNGQGGVTAEAAAQTAAGARLGASAAGTAGDGESKPSGRRAGARSVTANRAAGAAAEAEDAPAAPAAFGGPQIVGLEEPQRPGALTYTAPSADGDTRPTVRTDGAKGAAAGSGDAGAAQAAAGGGNREARRRAAKAAKKR